MRDCEFSRLSKEGEGGPGVGPLAPVDVWQGEDVHVDVAGRGRKKLPQGIAVPPSVHKASFQRAVRKVMDNLWRVAGFEFKASGYPMGGPASGAPMNIDIRHSGSEKPPRGEGWQKFPRQGGESVGGTGAGAVEAMEKHDTPKSKHCEHDPRADCAGGGVQVYHGTTPEDAEAIEQIGFRDKPARWPDTNTGLGFFFTTSRDEAYSFATKYGVEVGDIVEAEISLRKPIVAESWAELSEDVAAELGLAAETDIDEEWGIPPRASGDMVKQVLQDAGYDGIIFNRYKRQWVVAFEEDTINVTGIAKSKKVRLYLVYPAGLRR